MPLVSTSFLLYSGGARCYIFKMCLNVALHIFSRTGLIHLLTFLLDVDAPLQRRKDIFKSKGSVRIGNYNFYRGLGGLLPNFCCRPVSMSSCGLVSPRTTVRLFVLQGYTSENGTKIPLFFICQPYIIDTGRQSALQPGESAP
jgi:hypothetical protein